MILHSVLLRCVDPVVTIAAAVSYRSPFVLPMNPADKASADQAKRDLAGGLPSDHMALLGAYQGYSQAAASRREFQFCRSRFLSHSVLRMVHGIRIQLLRELQHSGVVTRAQLESRGPDGANYNSNNGAVVSAALAAGLYPQLAMRAPFQAKLETRGGRLLDLHGSSVNAGVLRAVAAREVDARKRDEDEAEGGGGRGGGRFGSRSDSRALSGPAAAIAAAGSRGGVQWFAFEEVMQTGMGKHSVRDTTMVPAAALALLCGAAGGARDGTPDPAARCLGSSQLIECIAASLGVVALGAGGDDSPAPDTLVVPRSLRDWPPTYADQLRRTATGAALSHAWVAEPPIRDAGSLAAAAAECKNDEDREASAASLRHSTNESVRSAVLGPCSGMTAALGDGMVLLRVDGWIGLGVPAAVAPAMAALRLRLRRAMDDLVLSPFVARLGGTPRTLSPKDLRAHTDAVSTACDLLTLEVFGRLPASSGGPLHSSSSPLTPMSAVLGRQRGGRGGGGGGGRGRDRGRGASDSASRGSGDGSTRGPSGGGSTRGPSDGGSTRGPSGGGASGKSTRGPSDGGSTRGPSDGGSTRGPSGGGASGKSTRGPSDGGSTRGRRGKVVKAPGGGVVRVPASEAAGAASSSPAAAHEAAARGSRPKPSRSGAAARPEEPATSVLAGSMPTGMPAPAAEETAGLATQSGGGRVTVRGLPTAKPLGGGGSGRRRGKLLTPSALVGLSTPSLASASAPAAVVHGTRGKSAAAGPAVAAMPPGAPAAAAPADASPGSGRKRGGRRGGRRP